MASVAAHGASLPLDHLPSALLQQIMGFLDLPSLLAASAVSTRLHKCILSSLRSIRLYRPTTAACSFLSAYLAKHGQHVTSLQLLCSRYMEGHSALSRDVIAGDLQELPAMPSLQNLELQHLAVGDGVFQAFAACTRLTQLCINKCRLAGKAGITASDLAGLPHLQHLQLTGCEFHPEFGTVLSVLVKLTHLTLGRQPYRKEMSLGPVFQHITCATDLRELRLPSTVDQHTAPSSFWSLTALQQLSSLQVDAGVRVNAGIPSSLQRLDMCVREVDPALLASELQLKHLELRFADRCFPSSAAAARASEALLAKLADQTQLTFLKLTAPFTAGSAAAYAALTISSQLQHLELVNSEYGKPWRDILPHIFPVSRSLPELRYAALLQPRGQYAMAHASADGGARPASDQELLAGIVSCCPSLQHLDIAEAMLRQGPLRPLLHVPHLTALRVSSISDRDAARVVAQLSKLQRLEISRGYGDGRITAAGLQHLTALQHLTCLRLAGDGCSPAWSGEEDFRQRNKQPSIFSDEESDDGAPEAPSESADPAADSGGLPTQGTDASPGPGSHSSLSCSGSESGPGDGLSADRGHSSGSGSDADCSASGLASSSDDSSDEPSTKLQGRHDRKLQASDCRLSDACLATIAQITSLRDLQLFNHIGITDAGVLELTALKQLTWLHVHGPEGLLAYNPECISVRCPTNVSMRMLPALMRFDQTRRLGPAMLVPKLFAGAPRVAVPATA